MMNNMIITQLIITSSSCVQPQWKDFLKTVPKYCVMF